MKRFFLFTVFALSLFWQGCRSLKPVECTNVAGFSLTKVNSDAIEGKILLTLKNPNRVGFKLFPSKFDVTYGNVKLGTAELTDKVKINGNDEATYTFQLRCDLKNVNLLDVLTLIKNRGPNELVVKGNLRIGKLFSWGSFPVEIKETLKLNLDK